MLSTDSTSSIGIGCGASLNSNSPRSVQSAFDWLLTSSEYSLKTL